MEKITRLVTENKVIIFSKRSCCLCYTIEILFQELGIEPKIHEMDMDPEGNEMHKAIANMGNMLPAVFIQGKLVGSIQEIMSLHLSGELIPMLEPYQTIN